MHRLRFPGSTICILMLIATTTIAQDNSTTQTGRPRKILVGDYSAKVLAIIGPKGEIEWQHPIRNIHDAARLSNGNILFQTDWTEIVEMTPDKRVVWKYDAAKQNGNQGRRIEVHAFQRLENGHTMLAESGSARIIEVNSAGELHAEVRLKVDHPNPHTDTRLVRKLKSGNYLVAHEGANQVVREYASDGQIVWEFHAGTKVYSAIRLNNGNTLIGLGDGHRVVEVDRDGKTVWSVEEKELSNITLGWITMVDRLSSGNTMIVNCHAGDQNPQIIEVDKEKKVVWTFKDHRRFGNSMPVAVFLE